MAEFDDKSGHWYTRRGGVVRGPFPRGLISRYILLGRIREDDEVRFEYGDWKPVAQCSDLIPDVMKLPPTKENLQKLLMARMREDERRPGSRRENQGASLEPPVERRYREDRRQEEPDMFQRHRRLKQEIARAGTDDARPDYRYPLLVALLVLLGFGVDYWLDHPGEPDRAPDCRALPRAGVNWDNCRFSGVRAVDSDLSGASIRNAHLEGGVMAGSRLRNARLDYTSLTSARLSDVDMSGAVLVGSDLSNADLSRANFTNADLSYANLTNAVLDGARFDGARLDHAIWVDRRECASGSVGHCLLPEQPQRISGP